jgi:hypothetical protein
MAVDSSANSDRRAVQSNKTFDEQRTEHRPTGSIQRDNVSTPPIRLGRAISDVLMKGWHAYYGVGTQRADPGSHSLAKVKRGALAAFKERQVTLFGASSAQTLRSLDHAPHVTSLVSDVSPDSVMAEPTLQGTRNVDFNPTTERRHASTVQASRRLRRIAKSKPGQTEELAKLRTEVITAVAKTCGVCPGGAGLFCAASPSITASDTSKVFKFESVDNSTYNLATVRSHTVAHTNISYFHCTR